MIVPLVASRPHLAQTCEPKGAIDVMTHDVTETEGLITARFHGVGGGFGPLTLGQDNMLRCIGRDRPEQINRESVWPVPEGTTVATAVAALRALLERHESLRTVFPPGPGTDGFPERQEVRAEGEFTVSLVPVGDREGAGIDALADELGRADVAVPFDLTAAPRLRFTLLTEGELVHRLVVVGCHAGVDGVAVTLLIRDWLALATGAQLPPAGARTPLELAALEQSPQGRRKTAAALKHWETVLSAGPSSSFSVDGMTPGPSEGTAALLLRSRTAAADLETVCRRTAAGPSVVLFAVFAALAAHRAARTDLVISALSANRQRSALADHIGTLAQDALIALEVGPSAADDDLDDLDALIGRTKVASFTGYWHSTLNADKVWQLVEDVAERRGARFARQIVVNDLSLAIPEALSDARPAPTADPEVQWLPDQPLPVRLMLNILRTAGSLEVALLACPEVLERADAERFARAVPAVLAAAAEGPLPLAGLAALSGLSPATRTGDWQRIGADWIDLAAVRALVTDALGARATAVDLGYQEGRLTARIATADQGLTPAAAHRAVVSTLPGRETAMAPHHYAVHHHPGPLPLLTWPTLPAHAEGSGRRAAAIPE
ncbi:condensation domain-containing protein [Kitasatospora purpeofusca]|uniref:condensation domain-containing protein n=1 Tax=Kitasatospora purpeofusca TaxID=67352 RepID=UPI002A5984F6|nr:condensation domain-containing protein [Kitasatospora purpeofusca]MDY0813719.1 condensation domain-containing protein [Kitasatospora purpeofusca]